MAVRLGYGPYAPREHVRKQARRHFLEAVRRVAPEVLEDLREQVFPLAQELVRLGLEPARLGTIGGTLYGAAHGHIPWKAALPLEREHDEALNRAVARLGEGLLAWARRYRLAEHWIFDAATATLVYWLGAPRARERLAWRYHVWLFWWGKLPAPRRWFEYPAWDPTGMSGGMPVPWEQYKKRVLERFERELEAHRREMLRLIEERGWEPTPEKREPVHFDWLALRVVRGMKPAEIAARYADEDGRPDEGTVRKVTRDLARLVGIRIPARPGRPSRQKP